MRQTQIILAAALFAALSTPLSVRAATSDETPPPAEAPYPNAPEEGFTQKPAPRIPDPTRGSVEPEATTATAPSEPAAPPSGAVTDAIVGDPVNEDVSNEPLSSAKQTKTQASATDEQQAYKPRKSTMPAGSLKPKKKNHDGSFDYGKADSDGGEYRYSAIHAKEINYNEHDKPPASDHSSFLRFAYFGAPQITNPDNNKSFKDVYKNQNFPSALIDYEWKITHKIGDVGIKVGSGIFYAQGNGQWIGNRGNDPRQPLEHFTFLMFPNTLTAIYRFRYTDRQVLVPYVEGGGGAFTFMETRDDSKGPKFGGAPTVVAAGGLNILIDGLDRDAMKNLRQDYSINHLYLNAELRDIIGFGKYNFGSRVIAGGIGAEF